jgi:hypothetical protein
MKKITIISTCLLLPILLGATMASAASISDPSGDVAHWVQTQTGWGWSYDVGTEPNIDITELRSSVSGDQMTIELEVEGTIQSSQLYYYTAWFNTSDAYYMFTWSNGEGYGYGMSTSGGYQMSMANVTASGNTISATIDLVGEDATSVRFWGYAWKYTNTSAQGNTLTSEWWGDWIPNDESPFYDDYQSNQGDQNTSDDGNTSGTNQTGDNGDQSNNNPPTPTGTPGFELLLVFVALTLFIFVKKKQK